MTTDKLHIQALVTTCYQAGVEYIVISPGSRSAPLVIAFTDNNHFKCTAIPDERVAGFFALGMAQQLGKPVAIICTSGTALLNLAPAVCEAYYQQVPLLLLTADRPLEYIGIGENQAIVQTDIYRNYIKASYTLPELPDEAVNITAKAIAETTDDYFGPVHINIPLREPLYAQVERASVAIKINPNTVKNYKTITIAIAQRNMLICGMGESNNLLNEIIQTLSRRDDFIVIAEPLSNVVAPDAISNIDTTITMLNGEVYAPTTIITIGKQIVSKRLRQYLRKVQPEFHYHIATDKGEWNGLGAKNFKHINCPPAQVLEPLTKDAMTESSFRKNWLELNNLATKKTNEYGVTVPFSDWTVFQQLVKSYPADANIQYGNSSSIRYAGFFQHHPSNAINANRGTSGIDGCLSTAAGAAMVNGKLTIAIVGDVSFLYDSNALWNNALSSNLRIIVINNGGGNIFRLIEDSKNSAEFETFFETKHSHTAKHLANMYQIPYYFCDCAHDLLTKLTAFYQLQETNRPAILEIKTDGAISEEVYKSYFNFLKHLPDTL